MRYESGSIVVDFEDEVAEGTTSAAVPGYDSKFAFAKTTDTSAMEKLGYTKSKKTNTLFKPMESVYHQMASSMWLTEISYSDYKSDNSISDKKKINTAINEINSQLFRIERFMNQNRKLKTELNIAEDQYWKSTAKKIIKMHERIKQIQHHLREMGLKNLLQYQEQETQKTINQ
jgi:hypothetical protein